MISEDDWKACFELFNQSKEMMKQLKNNKRGGMANLMRMMRG